MKSPRAFSHVDTWVFDLEIALDAAAYWIARSSRAMTGSR
jgi:hypothetical protein